jgi:tetratricopeptide (TPR) repeat protein
MRTVSLLQDHVAQRIADKLMIEMLGKDAATLVRRGTNDPDAYLMYLKGRYLLFRENVEDLRGAVHYFDQAVQIAPDYAEAYSSLASSYLLLGFWNALAPCEACFRAKDAALRAVEADPASALAHEALSLVTLISDWDWRTADKASRRAIELTPNSQSAHTIRCIHLTAMGRLEEAIAESQKSIELDPLSNLTNSYLGWSLLRGQHLEEAIEHLEMTLELEPSDPRNRLFLGQAYVLDSRYDEGITEIQQALQQSQNNSLILSGLGWAYAMAGQRAAALEIIAKLKQRFDTDHPRPYLIAKVYSGLEEKDLAFEWLEEAFCQHDISLAFVKTDESLACLRDDPRFVDLLRRMNLEP